MKITVFVFSALILLTGQLKAQEDRGTTTIFGNVTDEYNGFQVEGAWVLIEGTNLATSTDSWGHYAIEDVPVVPLSADFSAVVLSGPFPRSMQFYGMTNGGSPVLAITCDDYLDCRYDQIYLVENGLTFVSAQLHPKCRMRISADWNYYQYMNPVVAYLNTPGISGQPYQINSLSPAGSLMEPPFALFRSRDLGPSDKVIYLTFEDLFDGIYRYFLYVDKAGIGWGFDVPTVRIFNQDSLVGTITSTNVTGGHFWHVCDIAGPGGDITVVDQWLDDPPPAAGSAGNPGEKSLDGKPVRAEGQRTFSWDFGDGGTSTEQDPVHTYSTSGTFTVSLTVSDGVSEVTVTKQNFIEIVSGILDHQQIPISLKPNPARDVILLGWTEDHDSSRKPSEWKIIDSKGRIVMKGEITRDLSHHLSLDISALPRGIYFVRIIGHNGNCGNRKFIAY